MADPTGYTHSYSFSGFQANNPSDPPPGDELDNEHFNIEIAVNSLVAAVKDVRRSDGKLQNGSVTAEALDAGLLTGIRTPTAWLTSTSYLVNDTVFYGAKFYIANTTHTSGVFATDLAAVIWREIADFTPIGAIDAGSVAYAPITGLNSTTVQAVIGEVYAAIAAQITTFNGTLGALATQNLVTNALLGAGAVTNSKLATASVGTTNLVDGSVTAAKLAGTTAVIPVGSFVPYGGAELPSLYIWGRGQNVSRSFYSALFTAYTVLATATRTNGSATLTSVSKDIGALGLIGAKIEGTGIPAGTTVTGAPTSSSLTLSNNASSSGAGGFVTIFVHGNGDGVTTIGVPDLRGRVIAGRGNMGGTSANRLTGAGSGIFGDVLGANGGAETHTLTTAQLASHIHGFARGTQSTTGGSVDNVPCSNVTGVPMSAVNTDATGGGSAHNNAQPTFIGNYIIYAGA